MVFSAFSAIMLMVCTVSTGYLPTEVSPDSMMALVPSYTALATSETSARVGRGFLAMLSSIWVAVTTRLPREMQVLITLFWISGSSSNGTSTPRSPRATMTPFASSRIS